MNTCLFLTFKSGSELPAAEPTQLTGFIRTTPNLDRALVHTASAASDPYVKDGPSPSVVLQLYFAEIADLEAALIGG